MEYQGRFFVKVEKRANFFNDIIAPSKTIDTASFVTKRSPENVIDSVAFDYKFYRNGVNQFVPGVTQNHTLGGATIQTKFSGWQGLSYVQEARTITAAQIAFQHPSINGNANDPAANDPEILPGTTLSGGAQNKFTLIYGPTDADFISPELSSVFYAMDEGAKFRFKSQGTSSATFTITAAAETLTGSTSPTTGLGSQLVHRIITIDRDYTNAKGGTIAAADIDGIEIVVDNVTDLLTTNPAVFEVKPEKNQDLDIYYEASDAFQLQI